MTVEAIGQAADVYRRTADTRALVALIAANAIPLVGVLFFGWSLWTILVIYWLENGIVGFWNVPRLLLAGGQLIPEEVLQRGLATAAGNHPRDPGADSSERRIARAQLAAALRLGRFGLPAIARSSLTVFFLFHYGIFWVVHGVFVFALPELAGSFAASSFTPGDGVPNGPSPGGPGFPIIPGPGVNVGGGAFGEVLWGSVAFAAVALFISHGASFFLNYVGHGEYRRTSPASQMMAPYGRVIALHLAILLGASAIAFLGAPVAALVILVAVKSIFDLGLHLREHRARQARL